MGNQCGCCLYKSQQEDNILQQQLKGAKGTKVKKSSAQSGIEAMMATGGQQVNQSRDGINFTYESGTGGPGEDYSLGDDSSLPFDTKYLKITLEHAFAEAGEEGVPFMGLIDNDQPLAFSVMLQSLRLQGFSLKEEVFLTCHIGEDYIQREIEEAEERRIKPSIDSKINMSSDSEVSVYQLSRHNRGSKALMASKTKISRQNKEYLNNPTRWKTKKVKPDAEGSAYIDEENNFKYEEIYGEIQRKYFIIEFFTASKPNRPFSIMMIEFMALAIGPKHCDLDIKDLSFKKSYGRVQFDLNIQQLETMEITLEELQIRLTGKEERPLYGQFKVITNKELPKMSDHTQTLVGKYKKEKNETKLKWNFTQCGPGIPGVNIRSSFDIMDVMKAAEDHPSLLGSDQHSNLMCVHQEISLEALKNSTIQLLVRVDPSFSEQMTEKILSKIRRDRQLTEIRREIKRETNNIQGSTINEAPSNRQDDTQRASMMDTIVDGGQDDFKLMIVHVDDIEITPGNRINETNSESTVTRRKTSVEIKTNHNHIEAQMMKAQMYRSTIQAGRQTIDLDKQDSKELVGHSTVGMGLLHIPNQENHLRSRSMMQKRISGNNSSLLMVDAKDYYREYDNKQGSMHDSSIIIFNDNLVGECYLGFSKLLQTELRKQEKRNSTILQNRLSQSSRLNHQNNRGGNKTSARPVSIINPGKNDLTSRVSQFGIGNQGQSQGEKKTFEEQIWIMGKVLGTVRGIFVLSNLPVLQQMTLGVLTENGISMNVSPICAIDSSHILAGLMKKGQKHNEKITQLIDLINKLKKFDIANKNNQNKKMEYSKFNEKLAILNHIIDLLIEDDKQMDGHMFKYIDELDLMRAQYAMIDLAFHCLLFVESVRYELRKEYYEILSQIFMRDELRLTNLALGQIIEEIEEKIEMLKASYPPTQSQPVDQKKKNKEQGQTTEQQKEIGYLEKVKEEKIKIAVLYQKLLYQTLDDCLTKFCRKDVEPYLRSYLEICISVAFFRVPRFQGIFLDCIKSAADLTPEQKVISEWRHIDWDLDDEIDIDDSLKRSTVGGLFKLFDWELQFFRHIPQGGVHNKDNEDAQRYIRRIEANKKWQARVKKRSIAYFQIIKRWAELLKNTVKTYSLLWQDIPGYRCIVKSLLLELKNRKITEYPDSLIDAVTALVENPQLLTVVSSIVFLKTNAYDSLTLCTTMGLITRWLTHLEKLGLPFPSNFDLSFFIQGIKIALEMEHSVSTPRTLHLLFKTLHFFPIDARSTIIQEIMSSKIFYSLFFSWSYNIRDVFIALILYQVEYFYLIRTTELLNVGFKDDARLPSFCNSFNQLPEPPSVTSLNSNDKSIKGVLNSNSSVKSTSNNTIALKIGIQADQVAKILAARQFRNENLVRLNVSIQNIQENMTSNASQMESDFDKSFSMQKMRSNLDLSAKVGGCIFQNSVFFKNFQPQLLSKKISAPQEEEKVPLMKPSELKNAGKRLIGGADGIPGGRPASTLSQFIKTHKVFKKIQQEIDILEEYFTQQADNRSSQAVKIGAINETATGSSYKGGAENTTLLTEETSQRENIDIQAKKILTRIPTKVKIYVIQAIQDFYKQVEEYESWKEKTAQFYLNGPQADQIVISQILPEFNMEKNMPVEDDENLAKQEDW